MSGNEISYQREKLLQALRSLQTIVGSLDRIGSSAASLSRAEFAGVLVDFFDDWDVFAKLLEVRRILSEPFDTALGPDDMDELEREMQGVPRWAHDRRKPPGG